MLSEFSAEKPAPKSQTMLITTEIKKSFKKHCRNVDNTASTKPQHRIQKKLKN